MYLLLLLLLSAEDDDDGNVLLFVSSCCDAVEDVVIGVFVSICARSGIPLTPLIREKSVERQLKRTKILAP